MAKGHKDAVSVTFIKEVGVILAQAREDGTDAHDYIDQLVARYNAVIGELPPAYDE